MVAPAIPGQVNFEMFDRWSFAHAGWGAGFQVAGLTPLQALALVVTWEVVEPTLKRSFPAAFPSSSIDSLPNKVGDCLASMAGYVVMEAIRKRQA